MQSLCMLACEPQPLPKTGSIERIDEFIHSFDNTVQTII